MASITKKKNKIYVIYDIKVNGKRKQIWDPCEDEFQAQIRKAEVEKCKKKNEPIPPIEKTKRYCTYENYEPTTIYSPSIINSRTDEKYILSLNDISYEQNIDLDNIIQFTTVENFFNSWVIYQAKLKDWGFSHYDSMISNLHIHVYPIIGNLKIDEVQPIHIDIMMDTLRVKKVSGIGTKNKKESEINFLSQTMLRDIHFLVKNGFNQAKKWGLIKENPVTSKAPRKNNNTITTWDEDQLKIALKNMDNNLLRTIVHTTMIASGRNGEVCGLTWDAINFQNDEIFIKQTLQRVSLKALKILEKKREDIFKIFPPKTPTAKSVLVLKKLKTDASERIIYMTQQLKEDLLQRKAKIEMDKQYYGDLYHDYNLVFCFQNGDPIEPNQNRKMFKKWQKEYGQSLELPEVVFHSLRHTSTDIKLKASKGNIKAVQGDNGHSSADMVVNRYATIRDKDRIDLSKTIEETFYTQTDDTDTTEALDFLLGELKKNPLLQQKVLDALHADNVVQA